MADRQPVILTDPELIVSGSSLKCVMSHVELNPDVSTIEVKTSCGTREYPGTVKWMLKASLFHSYDPQGTNEVLSAAVAGGALYGRQKFVQRAKKIEEAEGAVRSTLDELDPVARAQVMMDIARHPHPGE